MTDDEHFRCQDCGQIFDDPEAPPVECGECGGDVHRYVHASQAQGPDDDVLYPTVIKLDGHPIPFEQEEIDGIWNSRQIDPAAPEEPPSVDEAHEQYAETIVEFDPWHVFTARYPFGSGQVIFWNRESGEAFRVRRDEGAWHTLVNVFAAIVEEEGDCRDAEYSGSTRASGSYRQRCGNCGASWDI